MAGTASWRWWATPTPASRPCSTGSPAPASRPRTGSSSTLDPRTRQLQLPGGETVLVTDTVGFVRKLPHELVEAFRSTLDSVRLADLVVHVVDGTAVDAGGPDGGGPRGARGDRGGRRARAGRGEQGRPRARGGQGAGAPARGGGARSRPGRARASTTCCAWWPTACAGRTGWSSSSCRGRVATCWPRCTARARWWPSATGRSPPRSRSCSTTSAGPASRSSSTLVTLPPAALSLRPPRRTGQAGRRPIPAAWSTAPSGRPATRRRPPWSRRWRPRAPSAAIPPRPAARSCAQAAADVAGPPLRPRRASASRRSRPASAPRNWWPRCPTSCVCASPTATPCCTPPCRTRPTPWAPSWRGAAPLPCPAAPGRTRAASTSTASTRTTPRARCVLWSNSPVQPHGRPRRPRCRGGLGPGARRPGVLRRVLRRVHLGRPAALDPRARAPTGWWPCTRCRSAPTWPASGWASTPATPSWSSSSEPCASTPGSWSPVRPRPPGSRLGATTTHVVRQRERYLERLEYLAGVLDGVRLPGVAPRRRVLSVGARARRALGRRLGHGRGPGP